MDDVRILEAAVEVVAELEAHFDPDRDSEYNLAPRPDLVGALVRFAQIIKNS